MGVFAWIESLIGLVTFAAIYVPLGMIFDIFFKIGMAAGGELAELCTLLHNIIWYVVPIGVVITYLLYAFIMSTRDEDNSGWR